MPPTKREMINGVHSWADRLKAQHTTHNIKFLGFAPAKPPKRGILPRGRTRRRYNADQYRILHSPAVQTALQAWQDVIGIERTRLVDIVNAHNRQPDERERRTSSRRITAKKDAALTAIENLRSGYNKIRGKV
jgi:hypothetical protein|tara:strand:- start:430 stop:828 length:399 start_codon:yes stop_codon:yes gene_type:complete